MRVHYKYDPELVFVCPKRRRSTDGGALSEIPTRTGGDLGQEAMRARNRPKQVVVRWQVGYQYVFQNWPQGA